jgi:curli biogenesis system outer membrane secretion channel CsgG
MTRARRHFAAPLALVLAGIALSGCVTSIPDPVTGRYARPIGGAPVIANETPYSRALMCLASYNAGRAPLRIAVGQIADYTGKEEADGSGRKVTQGAALMAMSALSKAGVQLVERYDTSVAELELKYANNKLIGPDGSGQQAAPYRRILAGEIPGSDYYLVGGITELNFNIHSEGGEADYSGTSATSVKANLGARAYVMNVGLDLRLVDTRTLEVVDVISYQKQIVGREISAGVFDIFGTNIINIGGGDSALEPIQLAVRAVIERAVLEMVSRLYHVGPNVCNSHQANADPLGPETDHHPSPAPVVAPGPAPAALNSASAAKQAPPSPTTLLANGPIVVPANAIAKVRPAAEAQAPMGASAGAEEKTLIASPAEAKSAAPKAVSKAATATEPKTGAAKTAKTKTARPAAATSVATGATAPKGDRRKSAGTEIAEAKPAEEALAGAHPAADSQPPNSAATTPTTASSKETVDEIRAQPYRWYRTGDAADSPSLRGELH